MKLSSYTRQGIEVVLILQTDTVSKPHTFEAKHTIFSKKTALTSEDIALSNLT